jgi:hypothetical protein
MIYRSRIKRHSRFSLLLQIIGLGILTLLIFSYGLYKLRVGQKEKAEEKNDASMVADSSEKSEVVSTINLARQSTVIKSLSSNLEVGSAERGIENGILYHSVKVSLPEIDRTTEFYEGWLVRQSPYDFFSTGEMMTNNLGEFVLEWAGEHADIVSYDRVIITREARDDNPAPSEHVAEGAFEGTEILRD